MSSDAPRDSSNLSSNEEKVKQAVDLAVYAAFNGVDVNAVKPKKHKSKIN